MDDPDFSKCPKHPSKRRLTGVCPSCLRDRLLSLCPDCANLRPCSACLASSDSSLRRSRSLAIPFLRSRPDPGPGIEPPSAGSTRTRYSSLWSVFKSHRSKNRCVVEANLLPAEKKEIDDRRAAAMRRSRSVVEAKLGKGKGWHFPSPIGVFRQPKMAVQVQHRSPMCRG